MSSLHAKSKKMKSSPSTSSAPSISPLSSSLFVKGLASLSHDSFWTLFSSGTVLPHLNSLPSSEIETIRSSYQDAIDARYVINKINFEHRRDTLNRLVHDFVLSVEADVFREEEDARARNLERIVKMMRAWLQDVFFVVVAELKEELSLAHKSLVVMDQSLGYLEHDDDDELGYSVENETPLLIRRHPNPSTKTRSKSWAKETIAYKKTLDATVVLAKMWRDLILVALSIGNEDVAREAIKYLKKKEESEQFASFIREEDEIGDVNGDGRTYDDDWHSLEMKAALPRLRDLFSDDEASQGSTSSG